MFQSSFAWHLGLFFFLEMLDWSIDDESESPLLIQTSRYTLKKLVPQLFFQRKVAIPNLRKLALYSILRCWNILEILTQASIFIKNS